MIRVDFCGEAEMRDDNEMRMPGLQPGKGNVQRYGGIRSLSLRLLPIIAFSILLLDVSNPASANGIGETCIIPENEAHAAAEQLMVAERAVQGLNDFRRLRMSLPENARILFDGNLVESPVSMECVWQIFVYLDGPELGDRSLGRVYLVTKEGVPEYFMNANGDFVKIDD